LIGINALVVRRLTVSCCLVLPVLARRYDPYSSVVSFGRRENEDWLSRHRSAWSYVEVFAAKNVRENILNFFRVLADSVDGSLKQSNLPYFRNLT